MKVGTIVRTRSLGVPEEVVEGVVIAADANGCTLAAPDVRGRTLVALYRYHDELEVVEW